MYLIAEDSGTADTEGRSLSATEKKKNQYEFWEKKAMIFPTIT